MSIELIYDEYFVYRQQYMQLCERRANLTYPLLYFAKYESMVESLIKNKVKPCKEIDTYLENLAIEALTEINQARDAAATRAIEYQDANVTESSELKSALIEMMQSFGYSQNQITIALQKGELPYVYNQ